MKDMEFRSISNVTAVQEGSGMIIEGTVNQIGEFSKVIAGKFREKINPGVFTRAITRAVAADDVYFLHQHDTKSLPLASVGSDTLQLKEEDSALTMRAILPDTSLARDIYSLVKAGVLHEFSFGFSDPVSSWSTGKDGIKERTLEEFNISEISIVRTGAYNNTSAYARALNEAEKVIVDDAKEDAKEDEIENPYDLKIAEQEIKEAEAKLNADKLDLESKKADVAAREAQLEKAKLKYEAEKAKLKPEEKPEDETPTEETSKNEDQKKVDETEKKVREYRCKLELAKKRY